MRGRNKRSPEQRAAEREWKTAADEVLFTREPNPEQQTRARELWPAADQTGDAT